MTDPTTLERLLPTAVIWAESMQRHILHYGQPLSREGRALADRVGVSRPANVRVLVMQQVPLPPGELKEVALQIGYLSTYTAGLTFGYGIAMRRGHDQSMRTLAHELRHVHQFEKEGGGLGKFVPSTLRAVLKYGYLNSPYELDARAHERVAR